MREGATDHSVVMGKPRSSTVTERRDDTDYFDANQVGSHDPLDMIETVAVTINDYVLAYVVGHIHQRPREH